MSRDHRQLLRQRRVDPGVSIARSEGWAGLFMTAFKSSRNGMALLDERRRIVDVNGACLSMLGYPRDRLIGHTVYEVSASSPLLSPEEWETGLSLGDFAGSGDLIRADGDKVTVQYAAHVEAVTGRRLVLFVVLSTSRWGSHLRRRIDNEQVSGSLSAREREVIGMVARGATGPEIADELQIAHDTVRTHVRNAMTKVGARSRAQLVAKSLGDGYAIGVESRN